MAPLTIIIPALNERYLERTMLDLQEKAHGEIEIIPVEGMYNMRSAINKGVAMANSEYIMKLDAHCMIAPGFDEQLISDHQYNWVQIPRRKRLDAHNWKLIEGKPDIDYMFVDRHNMGRINKKKNVDPKLKDILLDDTSAFQGSCYFMTKSYFNHLKLLDDVNFGGSGREAVEIVYKVKMDGGRVIRNKKTWYAHARLGRQYSRKDTNYDRSEEYIKVLKKQYEDSQSRKV